MRPTMVVALVFAVLVGGGATTGAPTPAPTTAAPTPAPTSSPTPGPTPSPMNSTAASPLLPAPSESPTPDWPVTESGSGDYDVMSTAAYVLSGIDLALTTANQRGVLRRAIKAAYLAAIPGVPESAVIGVYLLDRRDRRDRRRAIGTVAYVVVEVATAPTPTISVTVAGLASQIDVVGAVVELPDVAPTLAPTTAGPVTAAPTTATTAAPTTAAPVSPDLARGEESSDDGCAFCVHGVGTLTAVIAAVIGVGCCVGVTLRQRHRSKTKGPHAGAAVGSRHASPRAALRASPLDGAHYYPGGRDPPVTAIGQGEVISNLTMFQPAADDLAPLAADEVDDEIAMFLPGGVPGEAATARLRQGTVPGNVPAAQKQKQKQNTNMFGDLVPRKRVRVELKVTPETVLGLVLCGGDGADDPARQYVFVSEVKAKSPLERFNLRRGDIVTVVNGRNIAVSKSLAGAKEAFKAGLARGTLSFELARKQRLRHGDKVRRTTFAETISAIVERQEVEYLAAWGIERCTEPPTRSKVPASSMEPPPVNYPSGKGMRKAERKASKKAAKSVKMAKGRNATVIRVQAALGDALLAKGTVTAEEHASLTTQILRQSTGGLGGSNAERTVVLRKGSGGFGLMCGAAVGPGGGVFYCGAQPGSTAANTSGFVLGARILEVNHTSVATLDELAVALGNVGAAPGASLALKIAVPAAAAAPQPRKQSGPKTT